MHPPVGYLEISSRVPKKLETVVQASYDEFHVHFGSDDHHAHCRCHVREVCDCGHQELKLEEPGLCLGSATGFPWCLVFLTQKVVVLAGVSPVRSASGIVDLVVLEVPSSCHFGSDAHSLPLREVCDCGHQELKLEEPGLCGFCKAWLAQVVFADAESRLSLASLR